MVPLFDILISLFALACLFNLLFSCFIVVLFGGSFFSFIWFILLTQLDMDLLIRNMEFLFIQEGEVKVPNQTTKLKNLFVIIFFYSKNHLLIIIKLIRHHYFHKVLNFPWNLHFNQWYQNNLIFLDCCYCYHHTIED